MSIKVQCDLCRLSYSTEKELLDHSLSLMHHTKLEDREKNSLHECPLCSIVCSNMADYRRHISTDIHQKNVSDFKGDQDRKNDIFDSRKSIQISVPPSSWSDDATLNDSNKKEYGTDISSYRNRAQDEYNGGSDRLDKNRQNGSHLRFDSGKARSSHTWDSDSWKSRYNYRNDLYHWSRDGYLNQENNRDTSKNGDFKIPHGQKNSHFQPGTNVSSGYCQFNNSGKYSEMSRLRSDQERVKINLPVYSYTLDVPCNMDFTTDIVPSDWDENSFLEHEQFLHGVDSTYHADRFNLVRESNRTDVGKWEESTVRDRKRPRNEDDVQELLVKSSRSIDSSIDSDEHFPVQDVPRRHSGVFRTPSSLEVKPGANSYSDLKMHTKISSIDNASNNILERAERLCMELRQKREASEAHTNLQLTKQNHEPLNQKINALLQKQQMYVKVNIGNSKKLQSEENFNSSAKQLQDNSKVAFSSSKKPSIDSHAPEIPVKASDNKFSSIKKSVDKRVLENKKSGANNILFPHKLKHRSLSGGDIDLDKMKKSKEGLKDISGKPMLNPMSKLLLNKDNLKKMVNTPNSRDERLQLVKMLHSRTEQKMATTGTPRTHLQLEGLYDSVFGTDDVNLDLGQTFDSQTIKLENLSEGVRQQIMDLIGSDVSSQSTKHSVIGLKATSRIKKKPQEDVIILSDDEDLRNRKNKKNAARKMSGSSTSSVLGDTAKINKKKKIITKPSSSIDLKNSVSFSNSKSSITNQSRNSRPTSPVQKSNTVNKDTSLSLTNKCHVISCSSDLEYGKGKDSLQKENTVHDSSNTLLNSIKNSMLGNSFDYKKKDVPYSNSQSLLDSCSIREKFPTLLKIPKTDKTAPVQNIGLLIGSEVASIHSPYQNSADKCRDVSLAFLNSEADIKIISPKAEVKPSLTQIDRKNPSAEASAEMATLEPQKSSKIALLQNMRLTNRTSPLHHYESQHMPFTHKSSSNNLGMSEIPVFSPGFKNPTFKENPSIDLLSLSDMDQSSADGNASVDVDRAVMTDVAIGTSQTMTTLLMLSEKEEYVKQEKMSMDLRLSRLHKLLEQAVVQISKCTERMNKLHEEEQELLKKRLSLLRVATSLQPNQRCVVFNEKNTALDTKSLAKSENCGADFHVTHLPSDSEIRSWDISQSVINSNNSALPLAETEHSISLSKADWLAKFSSFLPQDTATTSSKITAAESVSLASIPALKEQPHLSYSSLSRDSTLMKLNISKTQPERDIVNEMVDVEMNSDKLHKTSFKPELPDNLSQVSSSATADKQIGIEADTVRHSANPLPVTADIEPVIHSRISAPIMYVGSFRSTDQSMQLISPFVLERPDTRPHKSLADPMNHFDSDNNLMVTTCEREDNDIPTHDSVFAELMHLPSPSRSHSMGKTLEFVGEESDIGSVASSMASGSSLGEQITQYCRSTPGASLDSRDPYGAHELSVIMSDTSEQRALDSSAEENNKSDAWLRKKEHWHSNVRPCSVSLETLDRKFTGIYYSLDEKAVRSAEALHLIERNCENTVGQSGIESENGKRRKRKTKQERETTGFTQRRSHWITVSSSEDEGSGNSKQRISSDMDSTVFKAKKSGLSSSVHKSGHHILKNRLNNTGSDCEDVVIVDAWSPSKRMDSSDVTIDNMRFLSPSKSARYLDVTVAECDSSTSMGAVDSERNFQVSTRKEIRKNFDQLSDVSSKSSSPDPFHSINSSMTDGTLGRNGSLLNGSEHLSSLSYTPVSGSSRSIRTGGDSPLNNQFARTLQSPDLSINSTLNQTRHSENVHPKFSSCNWKTSLELDEEVKSASSSRNNCRSPGGFGPVFDINIVKGQIYVGHSNRGVRVYNFSGLNQGKLVKEYPFPHLQCMTYKEHNEAVTLILGNGSDLVFCNSKEQSQQRYNLGTTIKCLLLWSHLVYAGLDTGEICIFDTLRMVLKDRCICSDHPIHCLASGKEGAVKLLCVSSQDGTIIVLDAQQFLPIRILRGHSKTAFSMQVEGHLVFSGSGDHTVLIHNLHTAEVDHVYSDSKGLVKSICFNKGCLFTGGMDKLIRCYDVKTHKLVQVYYGADRGVVTKILVLDNMLITGNISGSVDVVDIDIEARHRCHIAGCSLTFGNQLHLRWHMLEDHSIYSN